MQDFFRGIISSVSSTTWADVVQSEIVSEASKLLATKEAHVALLVAAAFLVTSLIIWATVAIVGMSVPDIDVDLDVDSIVKMTKRTRATGLDAMNPAGDDPKVIRCFNPATGHMLGTVPVDSAEKVTEVVSAARKAQAKWARTSFQERRLVVRKIAKAVHKHRDAICKLSALDTGKTKLDCTFGEILVTLEKAKWLCQEGEACLLPERRTPGAVIASKECRVEYHPVGVFGVIAPWNYPFHNMYNHILSCLFAGNGIVLKMSEFSCFTVERMLRIARAVLESHGHPNLIGSVNGFAATGQALVCSVDKVIFTGSPGVGKHIMRGAAMGLKPVVLELGGKDPVILCEDADVDSVLPIVMRGTFQGSGQNCIGIERVIVYDSIYDEFVDKAFAQVKRLRQGAPMDEDGNWTDVDMGATVTAAQAKHILELVKDAVENGATLLHGGCLNEEATKAAGGGVFVTPTLLVGVTDSMRIFNEEVFGPVMTVIRVAADNDAEAIRLANGTSYGLGSNVYSPNIPRAERIGSFIHAGMTNVNDMALNYMAQSLPFGGVKDSGFGRFAGREGLRACCYVKSITSGKPTILPGALRYPITEHSHAFIGGMMDSFYGTSPLQILSGVFTMVSKLGISGIIQQM
ncbi:hypothetical protein FNF27_04526 [Cafeteria roenbergensis]|uniref:Aldehyde dehydrogenase domain-containing protein n=1 Tax=Cafeteria roenbergensis TaxID=33653 RepID=A0A5A8E892_CAFRO|nr:hypothetical protein FNF27_04526 [Cafeteria roenbergensis]